VFIALTRQVGVLAPAMAGAGWLWTLVRERSWRNRWLPSLVVTSVLTLIVQAASMTFIKVDTKGIVGHGATTLWGVFRSFVHEMKVVTRDDVYYMWHQDRMLMALFIAALVALIVRFRSDAAAVFVGATAGTYVIIAGVGFASAMRYEMILFPAVAVMAGAVVSLAVRDRSAPVVAYAGEPAAERRGWRLPRPDLQSFLRQWGPGVARQDRWVPQTLLGSVLLVAVVGVSVGAASASAVAAPPSPAFAAAQGGQSYAYRPLSKPPAEATLKVAFQQFDDIANGHAIVQSTLDWTHAIRYRPTAPDQPYWAQRAADGTTITRTNGMISGEDYSLLRRFCGAVTVNGTVVPDSVKIVSRQTSDFGEDVVFTVRDKAGAVHRGTATTLYPMWNAGNPGLITSLLIDP
jgi:hypothetical protein